MACTRKECHLGMLKLIPFFTIPFFFIELLLYFELNKEEFPVLDKKCSLWLWLEITDGIDLVIILLALQFAH